MLACAAVGECWYSGADKQALRASASEEAGQVSTCLGVSGLMMYCSGGA